MKNHPVFDAIVGQDKIKQTISILIDAAERKAEPVSHLFLNGAPGTGKTTIANLIAKARDAPIKILNGASIKNELSIITILYEVTSNQVIFIDEIHRIGIKAQEVLGTAIEQGYVNITSSLMGVETFTIPPFSLIGASTSTVSKPLLNRFKYVLEMDSYSDENISEILENYIKSEGRHPFDYDLIAGFCRQNPRIAKNVADWIADYCLVNQIQMIDSGVIHDCLNKIGIYSLGLTKSDLQVLQLLNNFNAPVGLEVIASSLNMDKKLIENSIEPYLMQTKLILKTKTGRRINKQKVALWQADTSKI